MDKINIKDKAIILSVFGSVIEQQRYQDFKKIIVNEFKDFDIYLALNSRIILKILQKKGFHYKNLAQTIADIDTQDYKKIIVSSINLFPTNEHEQLKKTVNAFTQFSFTNIKATNAIFTKTQDITLFLKDLDEKVSKKNTVNLYLLHGVKKLNSKGLNAIDYVCRYLENKKDTNYTCTIEGTFPFFDIKDDLIKKMKKNKVKKVQIVPLLLISGNHYSKDSVEISNELNNHFKSNIVKSLTKSDKFNLLEMESTQKIIINNIKEKINS